MLTEETHNAGDYDRVGSQYPRSFLWMAPSYYGAVQYALSLMAKRKLESVAGSFDVAEDLSTPTAVRAEA